MKLNLGDRNTFTEKGTPYKNTGAESDINSIKTPRRKRLGKSKNKQNLKTENRLTAADSPSISHINYISIYSMPSRPLDRNYSNKKYCKLKYQPNHYRKITDSKIILVLEELKTKKGIEYEHLQRYDFKTIRNY
mmetsp:Transcript_11450/g.10111  ORF Transcript_11450/g.10111 Transcript_11450/m.10111 type:complete len:134 (+) Transcript_11450:69-470(+)